MWPCKKYLTYVHNFWCTNEGYFIKNISKICDTGSTFTLFIAQTNIRADRQTNFKMSDSYNIKNATTWKRKFFKWKKKKKKNRSICSKVMAEHPFKKKLWKSEYLFKSYGWTSSIYIYIYIYIYRRIVQPFLPFTLQN